MAENKPVVDANGIVQSGRYAGHHIDDVLEFTERLEAAGSGGKESTPPQVPAPRTPPASDPRQTLADDNASRIERTQGLLAQQFEEQDEAAFASTAPDYDNPVPGVEPATTYRAAIAALKKSLPVEQRMTKGLHRRLYIMIKMEKDAEFQKKLFEAPPATPPPSTEEGEEHDTGTPPPVEEHHEVPPATPPPAGAPARSPKPAPPAHAAPTPAARSEGTPPKIRKPKLKGNEKTERYCKALGLEHNAYLLQLEERGVTQEQLSAISQRGASTAASGRRSVYDYTDD